MNVQSGSNVEEEAEELMKDDADVPRCLLQTEELVDKWWKEWVKVAFPLLTSSSEI